MFIIWETRIFNQLDKYWNGSNRIQHSVKDGKTSKYAKNEHEYRLEIPEFKGSSYSIRMRVYHYYQLP